MAFGVMAKSCRRCGKSQVADRYTESMGHLNNSPKWLAGKHRGWYAENSTSKVFLR